MRQTFCHPRPPDGTRADDGRHASATASFSPSAALGPGGPSPAVTPGEHRVPPGLADPPRYRVLEVLGTGGMGTVYKAEHRLMGRLVALKVVNPALADRPGVRARFHREVRAAARLFHPNIVLAFD